MLNVIKMDLYRLFRSKAVRVGLILAAAICFAATALSAGLSALLYTMAESEPELELSIATMTGLLPFLGWVDGVDLSVVVFQFSSILTLVIATVVSAIFVNDEQLSGFGKNYLGQLSDKSFSVISKLISTSVINVVLVLVCVLVSAGAGLLFFGTQITGLNAGNLAITMSMRLLTYLSMNAIIVFLSLLTRSKSASMIIGVIFGVGASNLAYTGITFVLNFLASNVLRLKNVTVPDVAGLIPDGVDRMIDSSFLTQIDHQLVIRVVIVAVVYISLFTAASAFLVRKRDVK